MYTGYSTIHLCRSFCKVSSIVQF